VPHVQKGAALIAPDQRTAIRTASSCLALALLLSSPRAALASESQSIEAAAAAADPESTGSSVTLVEDGAESTFVTQSHTVAGLLAERGIRPAVGAYISPAETAPVADGTRVVVRNALPLQLHVDTALWNLRSSAETVGDVLREQHVRIKRGDDVSPPLSARLTADETIDVQHLRTWTARERSGIAPKLEQHGDARLPLGRVRTLASGEPGLRETTVRYTAQGGRAATRTILATRIVREPRAKIIVRGLATYASLARVAAQGFESAVHFAGSALHMLATAYTAGCYGCTGVTASGLRAGFGIIAVDPAVIPLGTKVFIPGYGRAVAADTGGAILGHRIDLGFDSRTAAVRFGRRTVTLYVLR
jgi:3D (Asp-Asp-Asp) domain-containing protein